MNRRTDALVPLLASIFLFFMISPGMDPPAASAQAADAPAEDSAKPAIAPFRIAGNCQQFDWSIDEQGNNHVAVTPLPRATVTLYAVTGTPGTIEEIATVEADDKGHFEFRDLVPPRYDSRLERRWYGLVGQAEGHPTAIRPIFEGMAPTESDIPFAAQSATLAGRLTNADGEPVPGATVFQFGMHGLPVPGVQVATTNKIGAFESRTCPSTVGHAPPRGNLFRSFTRTFPKRTSRSIRSRPRRSSASHRVALLPALSRTR